MNKIFIEICIYKIVFLLIHLIRFGLIMFNEYT